MTETVAFAKLHPDAKVPDRHSEGAAGYDIYSCEELVVFPGERKRISSGIKITVPLSIQATVCARSGVASKYCIEVYGEHIGPGKTQDVVVDVYNHGKVPYHVVAGERVAQVVFIKVFCGDLTEVTELSATKRGSQGWGSTGKF